MTRILRLPAVEDRTGLKKTTIYARIKAGKFPRPAAQLGPRSVGWLESDIEQWIQDAIQQRKAG